MAGKRKVQYIQLELKWMEEKFKQIQQAVDSYDLVNLQDRIDNKPTKNGGMARLVVASKEDQLKAIMFAFEKLPKIMDAISQLRQEVDESKDAKGGDEIPEGFTDEPTTE